MPQANGLVFIFASSRFLIVVGIIIIGDLGTRRFPYAVVRANVLERLVEIFNAERQTDDKWMERYRHYPSLRRAFGIQRIELIAHHLQPILWRVAALKNHANVIEPLLVRNRDHAARLYPHDARLIVKTPVANVIETFRG